MSSLMAQIPDLKIKGRLVFRPDDGDTEHDLGEVEFALTPQPSKPVMRGGFATGGAVYGPQAGPIRTVKVGSDEVIPQDEVRRLADLVKLPPNIVPNRPAEPYKITC